MTTVALHVWIHRMGEAAECIRARWPWLRVEHSGYELHLRSPLPADASALLTLRGSKPSASITYASAPTGSVAEARATVKAVEALCDALDVAMLCVHGITEVGD